MRHLCVWYGGITGLIVQLHNLFINPQYNTVHINSQIPIFKAVNIKSIK